MILADIGAPRSVHLARALDLSRASIDRYTAADQAPRPVLLSLWWLTRWGQSSVDCAAVNDARLQADRAAILTAENARLRRELAHLAAMADHGAANAPIWRDLGLPRQPPGPRAL